MDKINMTISEYAREPEKFTKFLQQTNIYDKTRNDIIDAVLVQNPASLITLITFNDSRSGQMHRYIRHEDMMRFVRNTAKTNVVMATSDKCVNKYITQDVANFMMDYVKKHLPAVDITMLRKIPFDYMNVDFVKSVLTDDHLAFDHVDDFWLSEVGRSIRPNVDLPKGNMIVRTIRRATSLRRSSSSKNFNTQAELQVCIKPTTQTDDKDDQTTPPKGRTTRPIGFVAK